jgi:glycosyltransferase involved in cell wall biosynthesis
MKVEIFTPTYNGMYILPLFIEHYQERFPGCRINIIDNHSTDSTREYCESKGCLVTTIEYPDNLHLMGMEPKGMTDLKNECWKNSEAEWVIVVDQDELVDVWEKDLEFLKDFDLLILKGYDMFGLGESDPKKFIYGRLHPWYCKPAMFRPSIGEINYSSGAHKAFPTSEVRWSRYHFNLYHYPKRHMSREMFIKYFEPCGLSAEIAGAHYDNETDIKRLKKIRNI